MTEDAAQHDAASKLKAYGEEFMQMFDDAGDHKQKAQKFKVKNSAAGSGAKPRHVKGKHAAQQPAAKQVQQQQQHTKQQLARPPQCPTPSSSTPASDPDQPVAGPGPGSKRARDEIETIIFEHKQKKQLQQLNKGPGARGSMPKLNARLERKAFMSSKASKVHAAPALQASEAGSSEDPDDESMQLTPEEFKKLQLEVERLGASALDKKDRKKWQARMLASLGAKADKAPRMASSIGIGVRRKRAVREQRATELAIESGHLKRKGMGKKKRELKERTRDRGLMEAGPGFKNGILRFKLPKSSPGRR
mmetsp:Transcript_16004/g.34580  ORF Transcript_16004/g.34580 Transcript_16004/m.34580 type:complete len:306 (-) Transcript_16004:1966-2883(-)|eukprot:CAMPEP_0202908460 /NCGR_PEP_ID=MMETSP1392-20130828/46075_1 /ASSEMBLY_ACC=CAM_ASM_000868 /TAXON_ID=225041 /ORGANISM="Chlamydomonas chlamydogama, Strain SAG 11-48b" /LENGTH=305 /DNA_ID=CAMNT_0049597809 /DNA_START=75 /DNA_END=992 /DNA_ORIENTATION=+